MTEDLAKVFGVWYNRLLMQFRQSDDFHVVDDDNEDPRSRPQQKKEVGDDWLSMITDVMYGKLLNLELCTEMSYLWWYTSIGFLVFRILVLRK